MTGQVHDFIIFVFWFPHHILLDYLNTLSILSYFMYCIFSSVSLSLLVVTLGTVKCKQCKHTG